MKRNLMFSLAVGSVTLAAACGDDSGSALPPRGELTIVGDEPVQLPQGTVDVDYSATVTATGGTQRLIDWTLLDEDQFPTGLYISSQLNPLSINGRPRVSGDFDFRLQVSDSSGEVTQKSFNLTIIEGPAELAITTEMDPPTATLNEPYPTFTFAAEGGSEMGYIFSADPDALPPGMLLEPNGDLTGTPTREGTFPFTVRVRDSVGEVASASFVLEVDFEVPPFELVTEDCPDGKADEPYECELVLEGGIPPYELAFGSGGGQPPGIELIQPDPMGSTAFLRGVPLVPDQYAFEIRATDDDIGVDRRSFFVFIDEADRPLRITKRIIYPLELDPDGDPVERFELAGYEVNKRTLAEIVAIGGSETGYMWERTSGDFPQGCAFTSSTPNAILDCTPTRSGTFVFELVVTDSDGERSPATEFVVNVRDEVFDVEITTATEFPNRTTLPPALTSTTGAPVPEYGVEIAATGGVEPADGYGWRVPSSDELPPGLRILRRGSPTRIQGTVTTTLTGTYDFNVEAYDQENRKTSAPFRIEVVTSTTSTTTP